MKRNNLLSFLALGIVFALFNVIAFVVPIQRSAAFFTAYAFTVAAFAAQIPLWVAFGKKQTLKSKFLGVPIIHVGVSYLVVQIIAFAVFMAFSKLPTWSAVVTCCVILAFSLLCVIAGKVGANEINRVEEKIKVKRAFIQFLQTDIEMLAEAETDAETKTALKELAEKVRFSDPMSHEMLGELESRISAKVEELKTATDKKALIAEIELLIIERNKKCKILK